ncbi:DUF397 domain-containing protein [Streptomyces sp. LE64]|uniref:DUF397 domain-containing protein n=1 Tax=Streptomyces sp. LE64 TaxID=3448653 RepID=UPI0040436B6E
MLEGVVWRKSSYSGGGQSQCVEIADARAHAGIAVRDSKNQGGPVLLLAPEAFASFLGGAVSGGFARS